MTFLAPAAAWLLALVAPLLLLWFLKLKRPRATVSSLVLWQEVLRDQRVNAPFRRLRRNLLLFLQLLLLLLLAVAAMQPALGGGGARDRLVVLLDTSASMDALDRPGGTTRLQAAQETARGVIDGLLREQELCLVAFAGGARQVVPFTSDKRALHAGLLALAAEDQAANPTAALRLAEALARSGPVARVVLLSDGNLPAEAPLDLPFALDYRRVPRGGNNLGITRMHLVRGSAETATLFAVVSGTEDAPPATLVLTLDGTERGREPVAVHGEDQRFSFAIPAGGPCALELRLQPDGFDALTADNHGYLDLVQPRALRVQVTGTLDACRRALKSQAGLEVTEAMAPGTEPDLVVTDQPGPWQPRVLVQMRVGATPTDLTDLVELRQESCEVVDWDHSDPLLLHVDLADLVIMDRPVLAAGKGEADLEQRGYVTLVHGSAGPLLLRHGDPRVDQSGTGVRYALLPDPERTTLPYRVAFPVLFANLVQLARGAAGLRDAPAVKAGVLPPQPATPGADYEVRGPHGSALTVTATGAGQLVGIPAPRVGWLTVAGQGAVPRRIGVNLLERSETLLTVTPELKLREVQVAARADLAAGNRPLWTWLTLAALPVLLLEWLWFLRRPAAVDARART